MVRFVGGKAQEVTGEDEVSEGFRLREESNSLGQQGLKMMFLF